MKKMALLPVFAIMSMMMLSTVTVSVFALEPGDTITFTGKIAVSRVEGVIQWRIVVDGTVTINGGEPITGKYTIVKLWNGDIIPVVPGLFLWKIKRCQLRVNLVRLTALWKAKTQTNTGSFTHTFGGDGDVLNVVGSWRNADVSGVFQTNKGMTHKTSWGYIAFGTGTMTLASPP